MSNIEERLEVMLMHNQALLVAIAKSLNVLLSGNEIGGGYAKTELKRAIIQARPHERN